MFPTIRIEQGGQGAAAALLVCDTGVAWCAGLCLPGLLQHGFGSEYTSSLWWAGSNISLLGCDIVYQDHLHS